jgi:NAD(P)-dependent dehydrogenase (short-subunit alcohol dehydrogenase family)
MEELTTDDPLVEVGLTRDGRWRLDVADMGDSNRDVSKPKLDSDAVILVTGGAYGITADVTRALAEKYQPQLVLVGRSPMPEDEPESIRGLMDPGILRQKLLEDLRAKDHKVTPVVVERAVNRVLKDRQIRTNIAAMEDTGARVEYHSLDVKSGEAFGNLIDEVYTKWGRIDGVIHGAGVIRDKLIRDKSLDAFDSVFKTKVIPANILGKKLRPEMLKFLIFFSSVAGRFGNVGQADYSAANEVLNKLADRLSHKWPDTHVVSINWGPWDSGMVSDVLRRFYASNDIRLIPPNVGVRFALDEIQSGKPGVNEVVIGSSINQISARGLGR